MIARLGNVIYWIGGLIAAFWGIAACGSKSDVGLFAFFAALAFLGGWAIRYILSGNKSFKP